MDAVNKYERSLKSILEKETWTLERPIGRLVLFVDVETTGQSNAKDKILSIAWVVGTDKGVLWKHGHYIVRQCPGFNTHDYQEAFSVHQLENALFETQATDVQMIQRHLLCDVSSVSAVGGHNFKRFDDHFIINAFDDAFMQVWNSKQKICTSIEGSRFAKTKGGAIPLNSLHQQLFDRSFEHHNALADAIASYWCYVELLKRGGCATAERQQQRQCQRQPMIPISRTKITGGQLLDGCHRGQSFEQASRDQEYAKRTRSNCYALQGSLGQFQRYLRQQDCGKPLTSPQADQWDLFYCVQNELLPDVTCPLQRDIFPAVRKLTPAQRRVFERFAKMLLHALLSSTIDCGALWSTAARETTQDIRLLNETLLSLPIALQDTNAVVDCFKSLLATYSQPSIRRIVSAYGDYEALVGGSDDTVAFLCSLGGLCRNKQCTLLAKQTVITAALFPLAEQVHCIDLDQGTRLQMTIPDKLRPFLASAPVTPYKKRPAPQRTDDD